LGLVSLVAAQSALADDYAEAPQLSALVEAGELPPLVERIPLQPEVIEPLETVGSYGGTIRSALRGDGDGNGVTLLVGPQGLVRWEMDFSGVRPNIAESWEVNDDFTEYTFYLREGMKWSDGEPFTADDVVFAYELLSDSEYLSDMPSQYVVNDQPMVVTKLDDYSFTVSFEGSYRNFLDELARPPGQHLVFYAEHYCSKFHPEYADEAELAAEMNAMGANDWQQLMRIKCSDIELPTRWGNAERPTLDPWLIENTYSAGATQVTMQRNPYFWQVDSDGQQLPYVDALNFSVISDVEAILLSAINGQFDYQFRHIKEISNLPVLYDNREQAGYEIMRLTDQNASFLGLYLNHSTENEALRSLFEKREFKQALSLGIDRVEVDEIVQLGQGQPWQIGPFEESPFYNETLGTQFIEYDPDRANALLDELGLSERDADGYRLASNGQKISIATIVTVAKPGDIEALEVIRQQWRDIGIEMVINSSERSLFYDRAQNNEYDASADTVPGAMNPMLDLRALAATNPLESRMSIPWTRWYVSGGTSGEEPSENMKQRLALVDQWTQTTDNEAANALVAEILDLAAEAFEVIGVSRTASPLGIRSVRLNNVWDEMPAGWNYGSPGPALPQQWYYAD
tara:strand:- start:8828 stop:10714 length:1887 start_codon:yes stop_codon:yes gene_type:complete